MLCRLVLIIQRCCEMLAVLFTPQVYVLEPAPNEKLIPSNRRRGYRIINRDVQRQEYTANSAGDRLPKHAVFGVTGCTRVQQLLRWATVLPQQTWAENGGGVVPPLFFWVGKSWVSI